jgi:hypothetical protein
LLLLVSRTLDVEDIHNTEECRKIKKLMKQYHEQLKQREDGTPSHQREGKQKVDPKVDKDGDLGFQRAKRDLKAIYGHSDFESSNNEHCKMLYVMFGGSWGITSWHIIKTLRQEVAAAVPAPKVVPHRKWMETPFSFDATDYPKSMAGIGQLPLLVSPIITNIKLYQVLVDGGVALNLISLAAFKRLQIPISKLQPSHPFSEVGPVPVMLHGCISLPVTFGTPENFRTKSILFDVGEVSLSFNTILGRPALYQFMAVIHYGHLVLKMLSPNGVLKIHEDYNVGVSALEKLQTLAAQHEAAAGPSSRGQEPSGSRQRGSSSAPHVQPSSNVDVPMKTIQIRTDATQTTRIAGDLDSK